MSRFLRYAAPSLLIAGGTVLAYRLFPDADLANLSMVYLLANVLIAVRWGQGPAVLSAVLSIAAFDFYFVPPHLAFKPSDSKYFLTFAVMFSVTFLTSRLVLSSRKNAEKALDAEMKAEKERLLSSLLSSVSHDLRTPLASITGAASTLMSQEGDLSSDDRRNLESVIFLEAERMNGHVENLLQITRVESDRFQVEKDWGSLEEIVGSALARAKPFLGNRSVSVSLPEDLPLVPMDALLIEQVLVNLLDNVARHTPADLPVGTRAFRDGAQVVLEVSDLGPGVAAADREKIFEKFYRKAGKDVPGSGLGLAICRAVVGAHGGTIGVRDREGGGSIFFFSLPLAEEGEGS